MIDLLLLNNYSFKVVALFPMSQLSIIKSPFCRVYTSSPHLSIDRKPYLISFLPFSEMKIQCDVCSGDEASVFCCADEAALCDACDRRVHHANKLASKHRRFSLSSAEQTQLLMCDICKVTVYLYRIFVPLIVFVKTKR